jgi:DNA-binding NarL/FixJ family response regulator
VTIRILLADDQELVRTGFRMILDAEPDLEVVGEAANGQEAVARARELAPDIVLMDIRMPELDGIEATRRIAALGEPSPRVLILTTFDLDEYVFDALRAGASGFLLKDSAAAQPAAGVRMVMAGEALLAPSITRRLIEEFATAPDPRDARPALAELTPREQEILLLMARGMANDEIAARLVIGESTVKTHVARALAKLGLRDRVQAVVYAYENGLIRPGRSG